ncbi:MAG: FliA/WhiG family RNA polymerase sigma factor [Clostridiales bacterium]|jgi:RNA polymerase sigma factor for flagellar operon FliA|nr:FliA/WhiG family RNA polymerase sigma factor [Clostridiales bacterium]
MAITDNARADMLWEAYARDRSVENRNELVLHYVYLVRNIVYRLLPVYKGYSSYDDLLSCGVLGLIDAIDKFALKRDVRFEYYASMRVKGEMIDHMRKQDWAPSSLRRKIQSISAAYSDLEKIYARTPTDKEVADHLGIEEDKLHKIMDKAHMFNVLHFEEMLGDDYSLEYVVQDKGGTSEEKLINKEIKRILGGLIDNLPTKERLVVTLYYYEELTLKEIAAVLKVSESRVSQIHSKVILKLRTKMTSIYNE